MAVSQVGEQAASCGQLTVSPTDEEEPPPAECQSDDDCPEGQVCRDGECVDEVVAGLTRNEALIAGSVLALGGLGAVSLISGRGERPIRRFPPQRQRQRRRRR